MKTQKRMVWISVVLVVMLLLATGSASARATRTPYTYLEFSCKLIEPGWQWFSGDEPIWHVRGRIIEDYLVSDETRIAGPVTVEINADINMATGDGNGRGKWTGLPDAVDGTWEGIYSGHWTAMALSSSRIVAHGTGELAGLKMLGDLRTSEVPVNPPPDCPDPLPGVGSGVILASHGE